MDLATADHLLTTTRSVRKRLDFSKPVDLGRDRTCIEIALQAPTGSNAQGWQFVVVTDRRQAQRRSPTSTARRSSCTPNNPDLRPDVRATTTCARKQMPRVVDSAMLPRRAHARGAGAS